jgi:hypothetical protein
MNNQLNESTTSSITRSQETEKIKQIEIEYFLVRNNEDNGARLEYFSRQIELIRGERGVEYEFFSTAFDGENYLNILDAMAIDLNLDEAQFDPLLQYEAENSYIELELLPEFRRILRATHEEKIQYLSKVAPQIFRKQVHTYRMLKTELKESEPEKIISKLVEKLRLEIETVESIILRAKSDKRELKSQITWH